MIGNGNNGTEVNGADYDTGIIGQAVILGGIDDYVEIPHSTSFEIANNTVWTEAFWFKTAFTLFGWGRFAHNRVNILQRAPSNYDRHTGNWARFAEF